MFFKPGVHESQRNFIHFHGYLSPILKGMAERSEYIQGNTEKEGGNQGKQIFVHF